MRKNFLFTLLAVLLTLCFCANEQPGAATAEPQQPAGGEIAEPAPVIPDSVAGSFYPAEPQKLKKDIEACLEAAEISAIDGEIVAAIVPHAGYVYSAPVAAYAYKALAANLDRQDKSARELDAIFLLAFSHRTSPPYVSVLAKGAMETPLGLAKAHEAIAQQFMDSGGAFSFSEHVFLGEHSAEVQLPFIQTLFPGVPIVPVIFGQQSAANIEAVVAGLERVAKSRHILVIATTDLSHYQPYERARALDLETLNILLEGNPRKAAAFISEHPDRMCGPAPVLAALSYAESRQAAPALLKYANSGDTAGRKDAVVGYGAMIFVKKHDAAFPVSDTMKRFPSRPDEAEYLTDEDKKILLRIARQSLERYVREKKLYAPDVPASQQLQEEGAAFVTLTKNGLLRGCIGHMQASMSLYQTIAKMAVAAASQDPRFPPVGPDELQDIHIEISVNTPLRPVSGPDEVVLGKHGVVVAKGLRQGVFLPQVATDTGWSKEEFLRQLCVQKAGLPPDSYKNGARLFVFTSIIFEEDSCPK